MTRSKSISGFAPLIILLIVALIGAIGYFAFKNITPKVQIPFTPSSPVASPLPTTQTADPTADWKTYINPNDSYSFKYPDGGELSDYQENDYSGVQILILPASPPKGQNLVYGAMIKTLLIHNAEIQSLAKTSQQNELNSLSDNNSASTVSEVQQVKFGQDDRVAYQYIVSGEPTVRVVFAQIGKNVLQVACYYGGRDQAEENKYKNLVDQILSTFKFTNP